MMLVGRKENYMQDNSQPQQFPEGNIIPAKESADRCLRGRCVIFALMAVFMLAVVVFQSEMIVSNNYNLARAKMEITEKEKINPLLKLEVSRLKSPVHIQQIAFNQLKMVRPGNVFIGTVDSAKSQENPESGINSNSALARARNTP